MGKDDFINSGEPSRERSDDLFRPVPDSGSNNAISEIMQNIFPQDDTLFYDNTVSGTPEGYGDDNFDGPDDFDLDYENYDTFQDSGEYRSFDGNREYRSFDASLPDASPDEWYHYSAEDQELDEDDYDGYDDYDDYDDYEPRKKAVKKSRKTSRKKARKARPEKRRHPVLSIIAHALLVFFTVFSAVYLFGLYSNNRVIAQMRTMYIQTAMSTLNHKWLATAIIPGDIIDDVMRVQYETDNAMVGVESNWGAVTIQELPSFESKTIAHSDVSEEPAEETAEDPAIPGRSYESPDEQTFFELFWELDYDSVQAYMAEHPEALEDGWAGVNINESGLDEEGTSIKTIYGDQVLAVNARDGVMLARVYLSSNKSRGVLAICKDTSRLRLCAADTLGIIGQTAGRICEANDGLLAITGSAFMDDGTGNGGQISGLAVCEGEEYGSRLGEDGDKRLELREDNRMYIVDSTSELGEGTRDACEFHPGLIIDGEVFYNDFWNSPNPRAVLGQTERLETMMVVVEGRLADSLGCGTQDVADLMKQYGCVQALNLDGGTSAIMYYDGEYITRCSNTDLPGGRTLPSAWVYLYAD